MPDLSIIIPVYNTPVDLLDRCFRSILQIKDIAYEVLLIDDGSCQETADFCEQYADSHNGFVCFHKPNGGVSSARNMGLANAQGKYVMFVDADDELICTALPSVIKTTDQDLIIFDTTLIQSESRSDWCAFDGSSGPVSRQDTLRRLILSSSLNGPYAKLYKTQLLQENALVFDENFVTGEDWFFVCNFSLLSSSIQYVAHSSYQYYRDSGNAVARLKRFPDKMLSNLIGMYHKKIQIIQTEFADTADNHILLSAAAASLIETLFNCAGDLALMRMQTAQRKTQIREICRSAQQYLLPDASAKTRMKAKLIQNFWPAITPLGYLRSVYLKLKH